MKDLYSFVFFQICIFALFFLLKIISLIQEEIERRNYNKRKKIKDYEK